MSHSSRDAAANEAFEFVLPIALDNFFGVSNLRLFNHFP